MSLCIMIVEDEMLLAMDLEDILTGVGHTVAGQASDMSQAVAIAERVGDHIDVAIMDVNLARGSNGVETAAVLRQRWGIPSLFVSGNLDERTRALALEWKPIGFVGKPYSEREVLAALAKVGAETI
ncbi:response regulator [Aureimonas pseudogalii]|uniref:DNA-binding response OmpR family regulator n=1 Tax=Aureimonas pseudogalii TaxID=1744844 RepID=A0A7W6H6E5_9HYPH|nr:response regulator [Aureimonas pseudogalii]MBB3999427.1 DNA-binding response OmpR family regulator [Aureimonas pseudogalii]